MTIFEVMMPAFEVSNLASSPHGSPKNEAVDASSSSLHLYQVRLINTDTSLAVFDLDETLIEGDSGSLWLEYLVAKGIAPKNLLEQDQKMMGAYNEGTLDMDLYIKTTLSVIVGKTQQQIGELVSDFIATTIVPRVYPDAIKRIEWHRNRGDEIVIISATCEHLVKPIAAHLGVKHSLSINLEICNGYYTGKPVGTLSYREGKVMRLTSWLGSQNKHYKHIFGYSDSINDLPLLKTVDIPLAVNPDYLLANYAKEHQWNIIHWYINKLS